MASERGEVTKGSIEFRGRRIDKLAPGDLVGMGMVQVMEGRQCFAHLTVEENLITGAYTRPIKGAQLHEALERVYTYFPRLKVRRTRLAGYLRWRAADDGDWPGDDGQAEHAPAG